MATEKQIIEATAKILLEQRDKDIQKAQLQYAASTGEDRELAQLVHKLDEYKFAGLDGKHIGVNERILLEQRDAMAARIAEMRGEVGEDWEPPREWLPVTVTHDRAGRLRLATDGESWVVRVRGIEYGCGTVKHIERLDHGYAPRSNVVDAAARHAMNAPGGPEEPLGSVGFVGGPDGEAIEVVLTAPDKDPSVIASMRARVRRRQDA